MGDLIPVMNDTKWHELRLAMYALGERSPRWRTRCTTNQYISPWDGEWYYHFSVGGFEDIEWVEIECLEPRQSETVLSILKEIHLPGRRIENGFRIYGYVEAGTSIDYI